MRFDTYDGDVNIRVKFEPRDIWIGAYWNLTKSIESQYRKLDVYVCILPLVPIHTTITWGWKHRDLDYEAYCQQLWLKGAIPLDYREWKHNRDKYGAGY